MSIAGYLKYNLGLDKTNTEKYRTRIEQCYRCEFLIYKSQKKVFQCEVCGCPAYKKAAVDSEHCPLGVW